MINYLRLSLFGFLYLFSIATLNVQTFAQKATPVDDLPSKIALSDVTGYWKLNAGESDDPFQKMNEFIRASAAAPASANDKTRNLPPMTQSVFHPDALIVAAGGGDITINEAFRDIVETRTFYTDGVTRTFAVAAGVNYSVMGQRAPGKLLVETVSPRGNKMTESYETTDNGRKLRVAVRIEDTNGKEIITLHRTYDRAVADLFGADDDGVVQ